MRDAEIFGIVHAADQIGNQRKGACRDDHRHGRKPVEPIGQIDCIARPNNHESREDEVEIAQLDAEIVDEGDVEESVDLADDQIAGDACDREFQQQPDLARNALVAGLGNLVVIVEKPDQPEAPA